ncbi:hypothetical protein MTO96_009315, partial [Rhipicephalus appendiculatus]
RTWWRRCCLVCGRAEGHRWSLGPTPSSTKREYSASRPKDREKLQSQVVEWYGAGVRFFGGCCGTGVDHMSAVVEALDKVNEGTAKGAR